MPARVSCKVREIIFWQFDDDTLWKKMPGLASRLKKLTVIIRASVITFPVYAGIYFVFVRFLVIVEKLTKMSAKIGQAGGRLRVNTKRLSLHE